MSACRWGSLSTFWGWDTSAVGTPDTRTLVVAALSELLFLARFEMNRFRDRTMAVEYLVERVAQSSWL